MKNFPRDFHSAVRGRPRGFTLLEVIMVIVITGFIAAVVAVFIRAPVEGYIDSVRRAELTDVADVALRRLARDIRLALPNSLRTLNSGGVNYIEFIMTSTGGRYRDPADGSTGGDFLSFTSTGDLSFDVLGPMPANPAIAVGDFIVVYNLGPGYDPANAYLRGQNQCDATPSSPGCNIAAVSAIAGNVITLDANPFANQSPPLPSPGGRFQVVPAGVKAVMFSCPSAIAGRFYRYANYGTGFYSTINLAVAALSGTPPIMADNATCTVSYSSSTALGRNGLLSITLRIYDTRGSSGEYVEVFRQIHVDNSP
jgi:MSHA biogenesis protein MshO